MPSQPPLQTDPADCPVCWRNRPGNELEPFPFGELRIRYCSFEHAVLPSLDDADPEKVQ